MNVRFQTTQDFVCMDKEKKTFSKCHTCSEHYEGEYIMTEFTFFEANCPFNDNYQAKANKAILVL